MNFPRSASTAILLILAWITHAESAHALDEDAGWTVIRGRVVSERPPAEITLNSVQNGENVVHSKTTVSADGSFGFHFKPDHAGFYTLGERGTFARLFLPSKQIEVTLEDGTFSVAHADPVNTLLAEWSTVIWDLKKHNQLRGNHTFREVFPQLPAMEKAKDEVLAAADEIDGESKSLFKKLVQAEFEYELYHFLFMPRSEHPTPEDYPDIYQRISSEPRFTDDSTMHFDFGLGFVRLHNMFQLQIHRDAYKGSTDPIAEICIKSVTDPTTRGWFLAKNVLTRARAYDEAYIAKLDKYRENLVNDEQRKFVSDFILTINKFGTGEPAIPFDGTTPDGEKVSISDFNGKVVLVDVWATWCGPCKAQIPHLKKLEEEFHDKDVVFLSYSIDALKDLEKWKTMVRDEELGGVQLIGDAAFKSTIATSYNIKSIPRFLVFDKKGNIVSIDAPRPSDPKLKALLEKHL